MFPNWGWASLKGHKMINGKGKKKTKLLLFKLTLIENKCFLFIFLIHEAFKWVNSSD